MAVRITKPEINISEKLSELDKPSGVAGESLLRAETPQEAFNLIGAGRKNLIINGAMQVAQRGTSFSTPAGNSYQLDRWFMGSTSGFAVIQGNATLPTGEAVTTYRMDKSTAGTEYIDPYQGVEDYAIISGKTITISCWVRTNIPNITFRQYSTGSYGDVVSPDGSWQYMSVTVKLPTISSLSKGVNSPYFGLSTNISSSHPVNAFLEFTHFQLELGRVATPFEHRSYGEELALCKRYYQRLDYGTGLNNFPYPRLFIDAAGFYESNPFMYEVQMRAAPTITASDVSLYTMDPWAEVTTITGLYFRSYSSGFQVASTTTSNGSFYQWHLHVPVIFDAEM